MQPTKIQSSYAMASSISYTIRPSPRAKRVSIHVDLNGAVEVVMPKRCSVKRAKQFVSEREEWIRESVAMQRAKMRNRIIFRFVDGAQVPFLGTLLTIQVTSGNKRTRVFRRGFILHVCTTDDKKKTIHAALEKWYREQARAFYTEEADRISKQLKTRYNRIAIKDQKSVWGSCSRDKNLNFSWRLMFSPRAVARYIAVHECCHLRVMDHSKRFWNLVETVDPRYEEKEAWLQEHGYTLR